MDEASPCGPAVGRKAEAGGATREAGGQNGNVKHRVGHGLVTGVEREGLCNARKWTIAPSVRYPGPPLALPTHFFPLALPSPFPTHTLLPPCPPPPVTLARSWN